MMEDTRSVVSRFWEEVYSGGNLDALDELVSPDYKLHDLANRREYDAEGLKGLLSGIWAGIPGTRVRREDPVPAEGGKVVTRFTVHVRLRKGVATAGEPAPGDEELELNGISLSRVSEGKIEETWLLWESLLAEQRIGPGDNSWRWPPWRW